LKGHGRPRVSAETEADECCARRYTP
jgi:hypothetical protein